MGKLRRYQVSGSLRTELKMPEPVSTYFFATLQDVNQGLVAIEAEHRVQYVKHAFSPSPEYTSFSSAFDLPGLGECASGSSIQSDRYLLIESGLIVNVEAVPQRRGGVLYAVNQVKNSSAAFLALGGICQPNCLIAWELMATSDPRSHEMYSLFRRVLLHGFKKVKYALVGPEALLFYWQGWRLTQDAGRNPLYDLQMP